MTHLVYSEPVISHASQTSLVLGSELYLIAQHYTAPISFRSLPSDADACAVAAHDRQCRRGVRGNSSSLSSNSVTPGTLALLQMPR